MADYSPKYDAVTVEKYLTSIFGPPVKKHKTEARKIKRMFTGRTLEQERDEALQSILSSLGLTRSPKLPEVQN